MNMRILIVGDLVRGGLARAYARAFSALGHNTGTVDERELYYSSTSLARNRYLSRLFWRVFALWIQRKLIKEIVIRKPDLVFVIKGSFVRPRTLPAIKKTLPNVALYNFNPDNPFNTSHSSSNNWIRRSLSLYNVYFIWGKFLLEPLVRAGAKQVERLPFGYDPKLHYPVEVPPREEKLYGSDIAFIGSWDREREQWLGHLLNYNLKIWGNHWEKAGKNIRERWQKREMIGEEFSKVCGASKIVLNFIRKQNDPAHNMRTFEVPACEGFMLSTATQEQRSFFEEGKEAEYFTTPEELKKKLDFYLKRDDMRKKVARAGYQKLISSYHSYKDRAKKILRVYNDSQ